MWLPREAFGEEVSGPRLSLQGVGWWGAVGDYVMVHHGFGFTSPSTSIVTLGNPWLCHTWGLSFNAFIRVPTFWLRLLNGSLYKVPPFWEQKFWPTATCNHPGVDRIYV